MKRYDLAVVIGRLQPLHLGHEELIKNALHTADHVLILLGSSNENRTKKNPLTFFERREIIEHTFAKDSCRIIVKPLPDRNSNTHWVNHLQYCIEETIQEIAADSVCFVVANKDALTTQSNNLLHQLPYGFLAIPPYYSLSATSVRESLLAGIHPSSIVTIPSEVQKYLSKHWARVQKEILLKEERSLKWYNRKPFSYLTNLF